MAAAQNYCGELRPTGRSLDGPLLVVYGAAGRSNGLLRALILLAYFALPQTVLPVSGAWVRSRRHKQIHGEEIHREFVRAYQHNGVSNFV